MDIFMFNVNSIFFWSFLCSGALLSLAPGGLGSALSPALMSNSTLATIQGVWSGKYTCIYILGLHALVNLGVTIKMNMS